LSGGGHAAAASQAFATRAVETPVLIVPLLPKLTDWRRELCGTNTRLFSAN